MAENNAGVINALKQSNIEGAKVIKDELKDQFKPFTDQLMAPLNGIKAGISSLPGVGVTKKLFSAVSTPLKNAFTADTKENINDQKKENIARRLANSEQSVFLDIRDTLVAQNKTLMEGLAGMKDKGLMGLGVMAGLVAAPFAFLTGFFSQLAVELRLLKNLFGAGASKLAGYFKPLTDFFSKLKDTKFVKNIDTLVDGVKNSISGKFTKIVDGIKKSKFVNSVDELVKGVKTSFTGIVDGIKKSKFVTSVDELVKGVKTAISTKFTALGNSLKNSKLFTKIDDFIKPIKTFATNLSTKFTTIATKGDDVVKTFGGIGNKIANATKITAGIIKRFTIIDTITDTVRGFINPIKGAFNAIKTGSDTLKPFMAGFKPIMTFAQTIGKVLGKIFLPITILMSAFDFVTGFMDGYDEGGILGGLEGGISKLFKGLIGMPLDLLKSGVGYILGFFGFDKAKEKLDEFSFSDLIGDLVSSIFDGLKGTFKFLTDLFDFSDLSIFSVFSKLIDLVFLPVNLAINFVKDLFGFSSDDQEPFSLGKFIMGVVNDLVDFFLGFFNIDVGAIVDALPGPAKTILKKLGILDETPAEKASNIQEEIAEAQARIAKFDKGENAYYGLDTEAKRNEDAALIAEMQKELELLKTQGGGGTVINNFNTDNRKSTQQIQLNNQQLQDANGVANS